MNALAEAAGAEPGRMSDRDVANAVLRIGMACPDAVDKYGVTKAREALRNGARAVMQLWHDLDREERLLRGMEDIHRRLEHA